MQPDHIQLVDVLMMGSGTYPPLLVLLSCDNDDLSLSEGQLIIIIGLTPVDGFYAANFTLYLHNREGT